MGTSFKRAQAVMSVMVMLLCISISGCMSEVTDTQILEGTNNDAQTPSIIYQFIDPERHFNTDDINLAQQEIPFTIIVPSYIPECFGTDYLYEITGPYIDDYSDNIEVKIRYDKGDYEIHISEQSRKITIMPNEELEPVYYEISGTEVLRQSAHWISSSGTRNGLSFSWNPDGLTFRVVTFNVSEEDTMKIVESMIIN